MTPTQTRALFDRWTALLINAGVPEIQARNMAFYATVDLFCRRGARP